jgi:pimeloyl-ACP methyl ester carboxylesterase
MDGPAAAAHGEATDKWLEPAEVEDLLRVFPDLLSRRTAPPGNDEVLRFQRDAFQDLLAQRKRALRIRLADATGLEIATWHRIDATWPPGAEAPPRIVVVVHGLHSTSTTSEAMALQLHRSTGLPMVLVTYPNDAPVFESANWVAEELGQLMDEFPDARLSLLAYSLGSLVSRAVVEMPERHPAGGAQRIDRLIMVCPPNQGSGLWQYAPLLEGGEIWQRLADTDLVGRPFRRVARAMVDGLNEASDDLNPESIALQTLNARARCSTVRYSIIAGDQGPLRPVATTLLRYGIRHWEAANDDGPWAARLAAVAELPELQRGRGDGVVRVESTQLAGVADWQVLPIHHLTWGQVDTQPGRQLLEAVAQKLLEP